MPISVRRNLLLLLASLSTCILASAQLPYDVVHWSATVVSRDAIKRGSSASIQLSAAIQDGWHVYALTQPAGGPIPLRVGLDENAIAREAGTPVGAPAERKHDTSFGLETQFYTRSLEIRIPIEITKTAKAGQQEIPVSVRFQACSATTCLPPRTVHLSVLLQIVSTN